MISTGNIGTGTGPYRNDEVKKDLKGAKAKATKVKAKKTNPKTVVKEVKTAIQKKEPMVIAIAKKGKK